MKPSDKQIEFDKMTFIDKDGYLKWRNSNKRVHRTRAYKEIYLKNRNKYPKPFDKYEVHHKDRNKLNNRIENLEIIEKREHEQKHGKQRKENRDIKIITGLLFYALFTILLVTFDGLLGIIQYRMLILIIVFIMVAIIVYFLVREKKGRKYI